MNYEKLIDEAYRLHINVKEKNLKAHEGLYQNNRIAINKNLDTSKEKQCVLAEELGHHCTSYGKILDLSDIRNAKQEKRARNWAYEKLVGIVDLIGAFEKGAKDRAELAEYLNVTEAFLEQALQHYREKYGTCYAIDHYVLYFEPTFNILKMF